LQFLNPAVLAGLVAALIPLAVHLLHRGHTRPVPFSNLEFLRQLHHSRMQRLRLRQWLVLLLRILIIVLVVCAFARPTYQSGSAWGGRVVPTAAAVLVDLSYSTSYRLPSGTLAEHLLSQVDRLFSAFSVRDQVALIPFAERPQETLLGAPDALRQRAAELYPTQEATDLNAALGQAARHLAQYPELDGELFLFTDLARYNWPEVGAQNNRFMGTKVYMGGSDIESQDRRANARIEAVHFSPWMVAVSGEFTIEVDIRYDGSTELRDVSLDLFVDGERVRHSTLDLQKQEKTRIALRFKPRSAGRLAGYVELTEDDLPLDNRRYFAFDAPTAISALVLGPQPADTYYARRALAAAALSDPALSIRSGLLADLDEAQLAGVDVVLLCNLEHLSREQTAVVHDFVAGGGGLVIFPSGAADLKYYNRDLLPGLLPVLLKSTSGFSDDKNSFQQLDAKAINHPLFAGLLEPTKEDRPRFYASFVMEAGDYLQALARFDDAQIALAAGWRERGRTVLAAFPLDLAWNDLPVRGLFAPLLHRFVRELSQNPDRYVSYLVGQSAHRHLPDVPLDAVLTAEAPTGERLRLQPERIGERYLWKIPYLHEAGIWHLKDGERIVDTFPVNVDTRESDLRPVGRARLEQVFAAEQLYVLRDGDDMRLQVLGNRYGRELWREFLALALALLLIELWVARAPRDRVAAKAA